MDFRKNLGFVIIGLNEAPVLSRTLKKLIELVDQKNIVYVDSGSSDGSVELCKTLGVKVKFVDEPINASKARQAGADELGMSWLYFIDGDFEPDLDVLDGLDYENYDVILGRKLELTPDQFFTIRSAPFDIVSPSFLGGNFLVRRDLFQKAGGWDITVGADEERNLLSRMYQLNARVIYLARFFGLHDNRHKVARTKTDKYIGNRTYHTIDQFFENLSNGDKRAFLNHYLSFIPVLIGLVAFFNVWIFWLFISANFILFVYLSLLRQRGIFIFPYQIIIQYAKRFVQIVLRNRS